MRKLTLLELVQKTLTSLGSDDVNSISDTQEATDLVTVIEDVYYDMIANEVIPTKGTVRALEALSDLSKPNYLKVPEGVDKIAYLEYNVTDGTDPEFKEILYREPFDFIKEIQNRVGTNVEEIEDFDGAILRIYNDSEPTIWTSFDDNHIVMDAYNKEIESTLQASKTLMQGTAHPTFNKYSDDFIPELPSHMFPLFLNEIKAMASVVFNQTVNNKIEKNARTQSAKLQGKRSHFNAVNKKDYKAYGRK